MKYHKLDIEFAKVKRNDGKEVIVVKDSISRISFTSEGVPHQLYFFFETLIEEQESKLNSK